MSAVRMGRVVYVSVTTMGDEGLCEDEAEEE